ncbi:terminase small subunit-like protein [Saccharibacter floricola]|uniref:terminase small subunit-like protein n=1 Tax=Saccharibacter floricola TaxID=231053 RepID=UPI0012E9F6B6|nr:hypothetical protein [Saccharibacter floricola]
MSFSQTLFDEMMVEIMLGKKVREICSGVKRPSKDTFFRWIGKDTALSDQYARAREHATDGFEDDILDLIERTNPENATANKTKFEMLRWMMARRAPKRYGDKQQLEHSGPDGGPITEIRHTIVDPKDGRNSTP